MIQALHALVHSDDPTATRAFFQDPRHTLAHDLPGASS